MTIDRRGLLALTAGAAAALPATAVAAPIDEIPTCPPAESFPLWPAGDLSVPSGLRPTPIITGRPGDYRDYQGHGTTRPDVGVFRAARPDGRAALVIPGGGYSIVSLRNEGMDVARVLNRQGITCFVLSYRLPGEGWANRANVPLADAQRAMRLIRAGAARWRIDPATLGVVGFSAGGHLAGSLATLPALPVYRPIDATDRLSARPAFAGLMYAVSSMQLGRSHGGSRDNLLGSNPDPAMVRRYDIERNIRDGAPPLFVMHAADDTVVPFANGLDLYAAARAAGVRAEGHFFERGGHGFGVRLPRDLPASLWPDLFGRWVSGAIGRAG